MYNQIYYLCKSKNLGGAHKNGTTITSRVEWIIKYLQSYNIDFDVDTFENKRFKNNNFYNIVMKGTSDKMVVAHHDIVNPNTDNANDNSASVINAIMLKRLRPDLNVVLLDGEEPPMMGVGSQRVSDQINNGDFGNIKWVLNLELTGKGGENFFIGNYPGELSNHIKSIFADCPVFNTPFNDSEIFVRNGIDSCVINPVPLTKSPSSIRNNNGYFDLSLLYNCHTNRDTLDTIDIDDMRIFTEKVLLKILE
jgi:hypothetical protein